MIRFIQRMVVVVFVFSAVLFALSSWKTSSIRDTDGPAISMDSDSVQISIDGSNEEIFSGVRASDSKDGDVTESLVVQGLSNFIEKGRRQAIIAAFDSDNNVTKVTREVIYTNYESPRFALETPMRFPVNGTYSLASAFIVTDCLDGDISGNVTISVADDFTTTTAGNYDVVFKVVNSAGDVAELPVTVTYYETADDNSCPKVLLSEYLIYVKTGTSINPKSYIDGITVGSMNYTRDDLELEDAVYTQDDIHINNPVDTSTPGTYEIVYSMENEEGNRSEVRLIVIVE